MKTLASTIRNRNSHAPKCLVLCGLCLQIASAWAQQPCPTPAFQSSIPFNLPVSVLTYQPDGSYTGISLTPPPGQFIGAIPNVARPLSACIPKTAPSPKSIAPGPDVIGGISARTPSGNYLFAQLNNPQFNQAVAVQTYDPNFNLIASQSFFMSPT